MLVIIVFDRPVVWHNINSPWCNFPLLLPHPTKKCTSRKTHQMNPHPGIPSTIAEDVVSTNHFLSASKSFTGTVHVNSKHSFISRSQSPPNHSPSPAFAGIVQGLLDFPDAWRPLTYHTPGAGTGARSATAWTARTPTKWFLGCLKKRWGENRGRNIFVIWHTSTGKKKGDILQFTHVFFKFVSMNLPQPKKAASGIDLSAFEAQIQQLEVQGWLQAEVVWCSETTRFWWISAHQFAMVVDVCNPDWDVHHDIIVSVSLKLYKCVAGVLDFLFVFCFLVSWALGQIQRVFLPFCVIFAASNFFCWKQTGRWSLVLFPVPCQERCEDAEMRLSTCAETCLRGHSRTWRITGGPE